MKVAPNSDENGLNKAGFSERKITTFFWFVNEALSLAQLLLNCQSAR